MAKYILNSVEETIKLGEELGNSLREPVIIRLEGEMGTGKTHFAKGIAKGMGIEADITSPTFSILNIYESRGIKLFHIDAYRIKNREEALDAGLAEVFGDNGVVVLEWGDLLTPFFEDKLIDIQINDIGDNKREMIIEGWNYESSRN